VALQTHGGESLIIDEVRRRDEVTQVFNVEIDGLHTYFVSDLEILSHNMCGGLENRGYKPTASERTIQGQVDEAVQQVGGNPTIQRGEQDLFRLRSQGHGKLGLQLHLRM
jgi:hypothetical protein